MSFIYLVVTICLYILFLTVKKSDKKQSIFFWGVIGILLLLGLNITVCTSLSMLHVNYDLNVLTLIHGLISGILMFNINYNTANMVNIKYNMFGKLYETKQIIGEDLIQPLITNKKQKINTQYKDMFIYEKYQIFESWDEDNNMLPRCVPNEDKTFRMKFSALTKKDLIKSYSEAYPLKDDQSWTT